MDKETFLQQFMLSCAEVKDSTLSTAGTANEETIVIKQISSKVRSLNFRVPLTHSTIFILLLLLGGLTYGTYKLVCYTIAIHLRLYAQEERANRIENIQRALDTAYHCEAMAPVCAPIFDSCSRLYHIPWQSFAVVARIESNYNPAAISPKGALGLMQVMPATAIPYCTQLRMPFTKDILFTPIGIQIGCMVFGKYFHDNLRLQHYDTLAALKEALKCYVGGENYRQCNDTMQIYVKEYTRTTSQEYELFLLVSKGVLYDSVVGQLRAEKKKGLLHLLFDRLKI